VLPQPLHIHGPQTGGIHTHRLLADREREGDRERERKRGRESEREIERQRQKQRQREREATLVYERESLES